MLLASCRGHSRTKKSPEWGLQEYHTWKYTKTQKYIINKNECIQIEMFCKGDNIFNCTNTSVHLAPFKRN